MYAQRIRFRTQREKLLSRAGCPPWRGGRRRCRGGYSKYTQSQILPCSQWIRLCKNFEKFIISLERVVWGRQLELINTALPQAGGGYRWVIHDEIFCHSVLDFSHTCLQNPRKQGQSFPREDSWGFLHSPHGWLQAPGYLLISSLLRAWLSCSKSRRKKKAKLKE